MLARIERLNPHLNAFTDVTADIARAAAKQSEADYRAGTAGPLSGVPVTIKDITFIEGLRCRRGSKIYADDPPASFSSPFVQRVIDAGAVLLGQTTTPELGLEGRDDQPGQRHDPQPMEPRSGRPADRAAGPARASRPESARMAHGTDGAGSIRIPSCFSGIFGLKPSIGLVPVFPASGSATLPTTGR